MDSSVAATAQLLGLELSSRAQETPVDDAETERERQKDEAYVREKSREELEKLLLKAEAVIRARERGSFSLKRLLPILRIFTFLATYSDKFF